MKFGVRMIATMAAAGLLVPGFLYGAEHSAGATAIGAGTTAVDSLVAADPGGTDEPAAMPTQDQAGSPSIPPVQAKQASSSSSYPRAELFLGYSYLRALPTLSPGNRMEWLNGGSSSIAFNLNRYLGLVADVGGFRATELQLTGAGANPARVANASGNAFTYMAGPRLSYRKSDRITPFAQALFGGIHASNVTLSGCTGPLCTPLPSENAFAMTAGGGIDLKVHHHIAIRLIQAEYLMTRFADLSTGNRDTQNDMRLSSGVVFGFGGNIPVPPVAYTCLASPASVYPGDPITVVGTALNLNPKKVATYTWATDGGTISGTTATANIDTSKAAPGSYTAKGQVSEGVKPGQFAGCSAAYTIIAFQPPTVSCAANPSMVGPGESSTITAHGTSPQNRPLTYSYSATEGSISGAASSATLNAAAALPGPIAVTCNVVDDKGQTASSTTTVTVQAPPPAPAPTTQKLCSINFERDAKRPTRVDNEAKACLDDVALNLQRSSSATVALVGHSQPREKDARNDRRSAQSKWAAQRAVNTKDYLVTEKGIDPSRVAVYAGSSDSNAVDTTLIPSGATFDSSGLAPVDEGVKPVARTAATQKSRRK